MKATKFITLILMLIISTTAYSQSSMSDAGVDENSHIPEGLIVGEIAPNFSARAIDGATVKSEGILREGPLVVVFIHGSWSGECISFLKQLNDSIAIFNDQGAQLVALSPEQNETLSNLTRKVEFAFPICSDLGGRIANSFDLLYTVSPEHLRNMRSKSGIDLSERVGAEDVRLPVTAIYTISTTGKIEYSFFDFDTGARPTPTEIIESLSKNDQVVGESMKDDIEEDSGKKPKEKKRKNRKKG